MVMYRKGRGGGGELSQIYQVASLFPVNRQSQHLLEDGGMGLGLRRVKWYLRLFRERFCGTLLFLMEQMITVV